jgi:phenylacetic acid degradation operon negative regulatory protein
MTAPRRVPDLGIRPLTARSLALSALLGTHPPTLPARALVRLGEAFGIGEGAMRTALSRMVASGDVHSEGGRYTLGDRLIERQTSQDAAQAPRPSSWDGTWWIVIVSADSRPVAERRAFRARMRHHRLGELRPDIWMRPANIDGPAGDGTVLVTRSHILDRDPRQLARQLWDLDAIAARGRALVPLVEDAESWLASGDPSVWPDTFIVTVAVARFLLTEPQLPPEVADPDPAAEHLRLAYDRLVRGNSALMAAVVAAHSGS